MKIKRAVHCTALFKRKLVCCLALGNDLNTLVETASLAYAISLVVLAALGALNKVGGGLKLPNARASLHLSRVRNFSLWYCHDFLL